MLNPKRILVTKFRAMGDTILLTAALKELHRQFPQAQIHAAEKPSAPSHSASGAY